MRTWMFYSVLIVLLFLGIAVEPAVASDLLPGKRVLIINSYGEQTTWSRSITDSLESKIHKVHPSWIVYSGDLKTEAATYVAATTFTLRSILWGYAERTQTHVDAVSYTHLDVYKRQSL